MSGSIDIIRTTKPRTPCHSLGRQLCGISEIPQCSIIPEHSVVSVNTNLSQISDGYTRKPQPPCKSDLWLVAPLATPWSPGRWGVRIDTACCIRGPTRQDWLCRSTPVDAVGRPPGASAGARAYYDTSVVKTIIPRFESLAAVSSIVWFRIVTLGILYGCSAKQPRQTSGHSARCRR